MSARGHIYRTHTLQRRFQRGVSTEEITQVVESGEVIEDYPGDYPYPSRLVLGWIGQRPLHVVVAENSRDNEIIVVTVYEPDPVRWDWDFRRRKT